MGLEKISDIGLIVPGNDILLVEKMGLLVYEGIRIVFDEWRGKLLRPDYTGKNVKLEPFYLTSFSLTSGQRLYRFNH